MSWLVSIVTMFALLPGGGPPADRAAVLAAWTQPSATSYREWNAARLDPPAWAGYGFVWSTDYCSRGPERPAGFDFRLACQRHDFGYRNYSAAGTLAANRQRLDRALLADLKRVCRARRPAVRPVCNVLAWAYYQAVRRLGSDRRDYLKS